MKASVLCTGELCPFHEKSYYPADVVYMSECVNTGDRITPSMSQSFCELPFIFFCNHLNQNFIQEDGKKDQTAHLQ